MSKKRQRITILIRKELSELSRERVVLLGLLVGPLILYIIFGGMAAASAQGMAREAGRTLSLVLVVEGEINENVSILAQILSNNSIKINKIINISEYKQEDTGSYDGAIIINSTQLNRLLQNGSRIDITIIMNVKVPSFVSLQQYNRVEAQLEAALRELITSKIKTCLPEAEPDTLEKPAYTKTLFYYRGELVPAETLISSILGAMIIIPMALLIVVLAATQVAAVSLGVEKEAKTLEKLLSMPVSFSDVIFSKVLSIAILSLGGVASNLVGLIIYLSMIGKAVKSSPNTEGFTMVSTPLITISETALLMVGLLLTLYVTILIGLIIGSASDDIRSSQLSASYVGFLLALPLFMVFFGLNPANLSLPVRAVMSLDPYFLLAVLTVSIITGSSKPILLSLGGLVAHAIGWTLLSKVLLTPENIILGQPRLRRIVSRLRKKRGV